MWPDLAGCRAVEDALAAADDGLRFDGGDVEVSWKRSRGREASRSRRGPASFRSWEETQLAVRVVLAGDREAIASVCRLDRAREAGAEAARRARSAPAGTARCAVAPAGGGRLEPIAAPSGAIPSERELVAWLDELERHALAADERVAGVDRALVRVGEVRSFLASSRGAAVRQQQEHAELEGTALVRDGLRVATATRSWAGPHLGDETVARLGERLGRGVVQALSGSIAVPSAPPCALAPEAVAELTFGWAPALCGLVDSPPLRSLHGLGPDSLRLYEDAASDRRARWNAVDALGEPLEEIALWSGRRSVTPRRLPVVRPGAADPPRAGWLRLSWRDEDARPLRAAPSTGLVIEHLDTDWCDARSLTWQGRAAGRWREKGRWRHWVARLPLRLALPSLLEQLQGVGDDLRLAHDSGTVRASTWLLAELPLGGT